MLAAVILGALIGALILAVAWLLTAHPTPPIVQLARFDARADVPPPGALLDTATGQQPPARSWTRIEVRLGAALTARLTGMLTGRKTPSATLRQDLALTGRSMEELLGRKVIAAVAGLLVTGALMSQLRIVLGLPIPAGGTLLLALAGGAGMFLLPDLLARHEGARARRDFRLALSCWLDLIALEMAASAAPTEALPSAARIGAGWPMNLLRETLRHATLSGQDQADALTDLGDKIGVSELSDLGTLLASVGRDGARARDTLIARAATMRSTRVASVEGLAGQRTQSMLIAQVMIGASFILFLLYPAIINVMTL
jgi:tight adherence protein C